MKRQVSLAAMAAMLALVLSLPAGLPAQAGGSDANTTINPKLYEGLQYRSLGFSRGGRSTAVSGVAGQSLVYYCGYTGGGVWKTADAGITWRNVSDGFFEAGSIGAIAVADSDPNVVYAGTGSACPRGNISPGVGIYISTDAGKTWSHAGLPEAGQIGQIRVHPRDHNLVYVAVLGHIFGPNPERGVYRSKDGGKSWQKVLFVSNKTGAVDLSMDPSNPRVIYAAMWTVERKPWTIDSGSEESGLFKTTDGGDTWNKVANGLPEGIVGRIAVTVSPADPDRVWALVEAPEKDAGLYRTDDGGESWRRVNRERRFLQRAWYYIHAYADPKNPDTVYVLNTGFYKSNDGGRTFQSFSVPHGDNHDLWINPDDPQIMVNANDGGANVSFNGARSWTGQMNQPTAEFYRVTVDNQFPYRVYGAQQDNSTVSVPSRAGRGGRGVVDFYPVGGGESGHIAVDPRNPNIVYAGSYGGTITRVDVKTGLARSIMAYPESATGQRALEMKYRFQWNAPIRLSPHDPDVLYHCSQVVHRSRDSGHSWEVISPDLTRNLKDNQDFSGKPITHDSTGVEVFSTIFALEESPHTKGLLWVGTDDGLVQISRDDGKNWKNITPPNIPERGTVNMIDLSAHDPGRATIAVQRYREDDFKPYIFRTNNYGESWVLLTDGRNGIPAKHFVRVVREDPDRKGLLYAGTEFGMYISFDDGAHWQKFQLNLPLTPVTDMVVYRKDLVVATQGRAFWILDNLSTLHQVDAQTANSPATLYAPRTAYRAAGFSAEIQYYFAQEPEEKITLEFLDEGGEVLRSYSASAGEQPAAAPPPRFGRFGGGSRLQAKAGLNKFAWDLSQDALFEIPPRIVMWGGAGRSGPKIVPGKYQVRLKMGDWSQTQALEVLKDPRNPATQAHHKEQLELSKQVGGKIKELYDTLLELRDIKRQATEIGERLEKAGYGKEAAEAAKSMNKKLTKMEGELTQLGGEGGQDALNYPGRLDNQFVKLYAEVAGPAGRPTAGCHQRFKELTPQLDQLLGEIKQVMDTDLAGFNKLVGGKKAPAIIVKKGNSKN